MPEPKRIVINTGPILSLIAALGDLEVLKNLYSKVIVPYEVNREILAGGSTGFAVEEFQKSTWIQKEEKPASIPVYLSNILDEGEASVVQVAIDQDISTVCIDESVGRRIARLHDLNVTGSIGILIKAFKQGYDFSMQEAINKMKQHGVWLSGEIVKFALESVSESKK